MAGKQSSFCSDEELLEELKNLGYNEIPPEIFQLIKQDLNNMVTTENSVFLNSPKKGKVLESDQVSQFKQSKRKAVNTLSDSSFNSLYSIASGKNSKEIPTCSQNYEFENLETKMISHLFDKKNYEVSSSLKSPLLTMKRRMNNIFPGIVNHVNSIRDPVLQENSVSMNSVSIDAGDSSSIELPNVSESLENTIDSELSDNAALSREVPNINISLSKYKNNLKNYKLYNSIKKQSNNNQNNISSSSNDICDIESSLSSLAIQGKLKRKILQHKDGKPFIKERIVDIPSIFNSSYPETASTLNSSNVSSSFDLSFKSNDSTGSLVALSPESLVSPRSTTTISSTSRPKVHLRKKKSDPVAMYNYYRKFWNNFRPPGEKNHDKLRWAVRDRMLDYSI